VGDSGRIDFGFRNPFAGTSCDEAAAQGAVARGPDRAGETAHLKRADFQSRKAICEGIWAVTARINKDGLQILKRPCPNLVREADLYRRGFMSLSFGPFWLSPNDGSRSADHNDSAIVLRQQIRSVLPRCKTQLPNPAG
jgi:hypothetical protein